MYPIQNYYLDDALVTKEKNMRNSSETKLITQPITQGTLLDQQVSFDLYTALSTSGSRCLWELPVYVSSKIHFKVRLGKTSCMVSHKLFAANVYWPETVRKYL